MKAIRRGIVAAAVLLFGCESRARDFGNESPGRAESGGSRGDASSDGGSGGGGGAATGGSSGGTSGSGSSASTDGGAQAADTGAPPPDPPDACVPNGCGACSSSEERVNAPCGDCGHYVCGDAGLSCENPRFATVQEVRAGGIFSCALLAGGKVRCWGDNTEGELGDGSLKSSNVATTVDAVEDAVSLSVGYNHACVLTRTGAARCWGDNRGGQLGNGTLDNSPRAVDVTRLAGRPAAIEAGNNATCVILEGTGAVQCWGDNRGGQLGNGTLDNSPVPLTVKNLTGALSLSIGRSNVCALMPAGTVKCWGGNFRGQLGVGTLVSDYTPVTVQGLAGPAKAVSVGADHACALLTTGGVQCWGANDYGQLGGDDAAKERSLPIDVVGLSSGVAQLSVGGFHSCAILENGVARCWGFNSYGGLGDASTTNRSVPVDVNETGVKILQLSAGSGRSHTCALIAGTAKCFGPNNYGQIGDGTLMDRSSPVRVQGLDGICAQ